MNFKKSISWLALAAILSGGVAAQADVVGTFVSGGFTSGTFKGVAGQSSIGISSDKTQQRGLLVADLAKPTVAISTPTANQKVLISSFGPGSISGTATDNVGVSSVEVAFFRVRNGVKEFWDGISFSTTPTKSTVPATLSSNETSITWSLDNNLPATSDLDSGIYYLWVYAFDAAGNTGDIRSAFTLGTDFTAPSVSVSNPLANQQVVISAFGAGTIRGIAGDNIGVNSVKVQLSRSRNGASSFWNGTAFTTARATVDAVVTTVGDQSVTWSLDGNFPTSSSLDSGTYVVYAYAYDALGNSKISSGVSFNLTADKTLPNASISTPTANQQININAFGSGSITGSATDNVGVSSVRVQLSRKRGSSIEFWNGTAFTTTRTSVNAVVTSVGDQSVTWSLDGNAPTSSTLDAGVYTVFAYAYDAAGNNRVSQGRNFSIFGTPTVSGAASAKGSSAGGS